MTWLLVFTALCAGAITLLALRQRAAADAAQRSLAPPTAAMARAREETERLARAFAAPPLDAVLADLRRRLPPEVRLAEAARTGDGRLEIAVDTPDPDALRASLRGDARLARLRERGQTVGPDGAIRVLLSGMIE